MSPLSTASPAATTVGAAQAAARRAHPAGRPPATAAPAAASATPTAAPPTAAPATAAPSGAARGAFGAELEADTEAGARMVAAAEHFAARFTARALEHDRTATFAVEHLDQLRTGRYLVAPLPVELGGGGVASTHDVLVAMSRLARGDAATSIGVNMHFAVLLNLLRRLRVSAASGADRPAEVLRRTLAAVAAHDVIFSAAASEPAPQDLTRPATRATRTADGGWRIDGRKVFATMAPHVTLMNVAVTFEDADGTERYGFAAVAPDAPGVRFAGDWDALGMRASESGSVTFTDVRIGADALRDGFPAGEQSAALLDRYLLSGAFHAAAALGVAEAAHAGIVEALRTRAEATAADAFAMTNLADNVADLAAMRATFDRAGRLVERHHDEHRVGDPPLADAQAVYAEVQAAKAVVTAGASRVADRALALSGGAGFMARHPLAKAWRDARAGAFMHPVGANRAGDVLARAALGLPPR